MSDVPYRCTHPTCSWSFKWKYNLDRHLKTHSNTKPYSCSTCSRTFAETQSRDAHEITHTSNRPFICSICNLDFNSRTSLSRHTKAKHVRKEREGKGFICDICGRDYWRSDTLRRHVKGKHPEVNVAKGMPGPKPRGVKGGEYTVSVMGVLKGVYHEGLPKDVVGVLRCLTGQEGADSVLDAVRRV